MALLTATVQRTDISLEVSVVWWHFLSLLANFVFQLASSWLG